MWLRKINVLMCSHRKISVQTDLPQHWLSKTKVLRTHRSSDENACFTRLLHGQACLLFVHFLSFSKTQKNYTLNKTMDCKRKSNNDIFALDSFLVSCPFFSHFYLILPIYTWFQFVTIYWFHPRTLHVEKIREFIQKCLWTKNKWIVKENYLILFRCYKQLRS